MNNPNFTVTYHHPMTAKNLSQTQQFNFNPNDFPRKELIVNVNNGSSPNGKRSTSVKNANQTK